MKSITDDIDIVPLSKDSASLLNSLYFSLIKSNSSQFAMRMVIDTAKTILNHGEED